MKFDKIATQLNESIIDFQHDNLDSQIFNDESTLVQLHLTIDVKWQVAVGETWF